MSWPSVRHSVRWRLREATSKVCRDAAYLAPGVLGEARLVCVPGENFGGEVGVRAIVNYKANDSHETTGRCKKVEQKGVTVRRTGAKLWEGVARQGEVRAHRWLRREFLEEQLQAFDGAIAREGAGVQVDALVTNSGEIFREDAAVIGVLVESSAPSVDKVLHDG